MIRIWVIHGDPSDLIQSPICFSIWTNASSLSSSSSASNLIKFNPIKPVQCICLQQEMDRKLVLTQKLVIFRVFVDLPVGKLSDDHWWSIPLSYHKIICPSTYCIYPIILLTYLVSIYGLRQIGGSESIWRSSVLFKRNWQRSGGFIMVHLNLDLIQKQHDNRQVDFQNWRHPNIWMVYNL